MKKCLNVYLLATRTSTVVVVEGSLIATVVDYHHNLIEKDYCIIIIAKFKILFKCVIIFESVPDVINKIYKKSIYKPFETNNAKKLCLCS